jgi:hypothetical protein
VSFLDALECFKSYLAIKNHFTVAKYDYIKYKGVVKVSSDAFYKRRDRMWFEKLSRLKSKQEILQFFIANFVMNNCGNLWIGDIIKNGNTTYLAWKKKIQSLTYLFNSELSQLLDSYEFSELFKCQNGYHPILLKEYLRNNVSIETMVILNKFINYTDTFDKKINDPIWNNTSFLINKYNVFLKIDNEKYKKIILNKINY